MRRDEDAHGPIALTVHTYLLLTGAAAAALQPGWALGLAAGYLAFLAVLAARPMREQM